MMLWVYGVAFSLGFWFIALEFSLLIQIIPLLIATSLSLLNSLQLLRNKKNPSTSLATLATSILLIMLFWTKPKDGYAIFSIVFGIIALVCVIGNWEYLFVAPPMWRGGANFLSLILTTIVYVMFYATIANHTDNWLVFVPFTVLLIVEGYIILNIPNMPSLCDEMKSKLRQERLTYCVALIIAFFSTVLYSADVVELKVNTLICVVAYSLGLLYSTSTALFRTYKNQTVQPITIYSIMSQEEEA